MSIVIVDDSVTNLIVLKHLSKAEGMHLVRTFASATEARAHLETEAADIIIVDCEMPEMNGIEFIAQVRRLAGHVDTPIVMVTNHSDSETRIRALQAGATDFLSKPVDASEYKVRVRNLLRLRAANAA